MKPLPDYHCPVCGTLSELIMGPTQAFCTNRETCNVISFDPSLPDRGLSNMHKIEWFECPKCHWVSTNPNDIREKYCGHCHEFMEPEKP